MAKKKESRFDDTDQRLLEMREAEYPGGVVVDPVPITAGEEVTVLYYGLLSQSGADMVWLHAGYGKAGEWQGVYDHDMERTGRGFVKKLKMNEDKRFNFCFKDSADNWDNNNGLNWSYEIHQGLRV